MQGYKFGDFTKGLINSISKSVPKKEDSYVESMSWKELAGRDEGADGYHFGDLTKTAAKSLFGAFNEEKESWKEIAGRIEGPEGYQFGDITKSISTILAGNDDQATEQSTWRDISGRKDGPEGYVFGDVTKSLFSGLVNPGGYIALNDMEHQMLLNDDDHDELLFERAVPERIVNSQKKQQQKLTNIPLLSTTEQAHNVRQVIKLVLNGELISEEQTDLVYQVSATLPDDQLAEILIEELKTFVGTHSTENQESKVVQTIENTSELSENGTQASISMMLASLMAGKSVTKSQFLLLGSLIIEAPKEIVLSEVTKSVIDFRQKKQHTKMLLEQTLQVHCIICMDRNLRDQGFSCSDHFICWGCLEDSINAAMQPGAIGGYVDDEGCLKCPKCGDSANLIFLAKQSAPEQIFDAMLQLQQETKIRKVVEAELKAQEIRLKQEFESILSIKDKTNRDAALLRMKIVETVLTLTCPSCRTAFVDFEGCFALTCSTCKTGFCAWCLVGCGSDAHAHVARCPEKKKSHPDYSPYHGTLVDFEDHHRQRKRRRVVELLGSVTPEVREAARLAINQDLRMLGILEI